MLCVLSAHLTHPLPLLNPSTDIYSSTEDGFPSVTGSLWLGTEDAAAVAAALLPKLEKTREEVEKLLFEVVTLEVRGGRSSLGPPGLAWQPSLLSQNQPWW